MPLPGPILAKQTGQPAYVGAQNVAYLALAVSTGTESTIFASEYHSNVSFQVNVGADWDTAKVKLVANRG
jgi:hypothetical protein